jgi:type I restriction enzyme S subunit
MILQLATNGGLRTGQVASNWSPCLLNPLIKLISGQHLRPGEYNNNCHGLPYLTGPADFGERFPTASRWTTCRRAVAQKGDILLTVKGAGVGKTNELQYEEAAISRQLMAVRAVEVDAGFLAVVLRAAANKFLAAVVGIAIPGISRDQVLNYEILLPDRPEQVRIAAKVRELMALCDELESRLKAIETHREQLLAASVRDVLRPTVET